MSPQARLGWFAGVLLVVLGIFAATARYLSETAPTDGQQESRR